MVALVGTVCSDRTHPSAWCRPRGARYKSGAEERAKLESSGSATSKVLVAPLSPG